MQSTHDRDLGQRFSRNEDLKPPVRKGRPPRPATEPVGAEGSSKTSRTLTNPATGEPNPTS